MIQTICSKKKKDFAISLKRVECSFLQIPGSLNSYGGKAKDEQLVIKFKNNKIFSSALAASTKWHIVDWFIIYKTLNKVWSA